MTHSELGHIHHCRALRDHCTLESGIEMKGTPVPVYLHRPSGNQFCLLRLRGDWILVSINARNIRRADLNRGWEFRELPALYGAYDISDTWRPLTEEDYAVDRSVTWGCIIDWRWSRDLEARQCYLDDREISGEYEAYRVLSSMLMLDLVPTVRTRSDLLK